MTLVEQEHLETPQDLQIYIARVNAEIDEVTATRSKVRNKQRNCTDPERMAELKKQCAACTTVLADLRKKKKTGLRHHRGPPEAPGASGERIRGAAGERPLSLGAGEKHPAAAERSGERGKTV